MCVNINPRVLDRRKRRTCQCAVESNDLIGQCSVEMQLGEMVPPIFFSRWRSLDRSLTGAISSGQEDWKNIGDYHFEARSDYLLILASADPILCED